MKRREFLMTAIASSAHIVPRGAHGVLAQAATATPHADKANPTVAGDGVALVPAGKAGTVAVVSLGAMIDSNVPFVVRNTTKQAAAITDIIGTLRDASGKLIDTVGFADYGPKTVLPQGIAFGYAYFSEQHIPLDAAVELVVKTTAGRASDYVELPITEVEANSDGFVGAVKNTTPTALSYVSVAGVTMADDGTLIGCFSGSVDGDQVAAGGTGYFKAYLRGQASRHYLVAASGR